MKNLESNSSVFHAPQRDNQFSGNVENFIGLTQVPTGMVDQLLINGEYAQGYYKVPLATTEGALVASYSRGASAIKQAGGVRVRITDERLQRCPAFRFENMHDAQRFISFVEQEQFSFHALAETQTNHGKLISVDKMLLGNLVILTFWYQTGDAAGQNMVTLCTDVICQHLAKQSPVPITQWYIESNMSGDKKASAINLSQLRGKRLVAEAILSREVVAEVLKSSPEAMVEYYNCAMQAAAVSGALGMQGHFANGLAALFLATGNDIACVAESAIGLIQVSLTADQDLRVSIVLPSFTAGTVGGGTKLPSQKAALELMTCQGAGQSRKFAEIAAGLVLAGELSIMAAIAEGHFTSAHKSLGR